MAISIYILGLGLGQLVYGPLADSFGRRPLMLAGLVLFTVSGCVAAFAPNVVVLVAARFAQAVGGCVGLLLPRAIVRDTSESARAVKRLAMMNLMAMAGPGLSPLVGGALAAGLGWRSVFVLLTSLGAVNLFLAWRLLPETGTPTGRISAASVASDYRQLLGSARFLGLSVGGACATTSFYGFITAAPFIFVHQLHRPLTEVGLYLGFTVGGAFIGSILAGRLAGRMPPDRLMVRSHQLTVSSAALFLLSLWLIGPRVDVIVALTFIHALGMGICSPIVSVQVMGVVPRLIGSAAGLYGGIQMVTGALCAALVTLHPDAALAAASVLVSMGLLGQLAFHLARRQA
jgi:DHA1 family bicyclomycin/chloramphenicol resistance-like MFS transporter